MEKSELRKLVKSRLADLTAEQCAVEDQAVTARILQNPLWLKARSVFCYLPLPTGREIDTYPLIETALASGKRLAVPRVLAPGLMQARLIESLDNLHPGCFGIPEPGEGRPDLPPEQIDLVIVPGIAFERTSLLRLGQGGGYYDRYLAQCGAFRLAPARACQIVDNLLAPGPHDLAMDLLVTAAQEYRRG
jgi:5-formyltetrahydrofolate cyclo-ligase